MLKYLKRGPGFYGYLWRLTGPIALQNLITFSLGLIDTLMVSWLGNTQMAAVTTANVPVFLLISIVFGVQSGLGILVSQYWGKKDMESISRAIGVAAMLGTGITLVLALVLFLWPVQIMDLLSNKHELSVLGAPYLKLIGFSYVFNMLSSIYVSAMRSAENSGFGMKLFGVSTLLNTGMNYILIFGKCGFPALGIQGAAIATLLSRVAEFLICLVCALRSRILPLDLAAFFRPGWEMLRRFVKYSTPVILNETAWGLGNSLLTVILGYTDNSVEMLAANAVMGNLNRLFLVVCFGLGAATAVMVGKAIGEGQSHREVMDLSRTLLVFTLLVGTGLAVVSLALVPTLFVPVVFPLFKLTGQSAAIAAALLLVGCGIVYALRLQDMSIGKATYTQRFDDKGKAIDPVEKSMDIITPYGRSGDAIQQALKEWYEFQESYDPDGALLTDEPDIPDIPNQYEYTYSCYTQEMVDKVDEIAAKYNLKLLKEWIPFQRYQSDIFLEETGIRSLLRQDSGAQITDMAGMLYLPYNFSMEFELVTENAGKLMTSYGYARKDYFPSAFAGGMDIDAYEQWDHTTPGGTKLLLALNSKGQGEIIAEQENAMIMISIDGNRSLSHSRYPDASEVMTKAELESIADQFDYSVRPKEVDKAAVEEKLAAAEADYQAEHAYVPETYTDFSDYLKKNVYIPDESRQYSFYDLTGDGVDELLLGRDGAFLDWLEMENGEVMFHGYGESYLCEGNVLEQYQAPDRYWDGERHTYFAFADGTAAFKDDGGLGNVIANIQRRGSQWYRYTDPLTKAG